MPLNYTPLSWKNVDPTNRDQMKVFLQQLADFLNSAFNPAFLSFSLNGQGLLSPGAMSSAANTLIGNNTGLTAADKGLTAGQSNVLLLGASALVNAGTISTNQTVNCAGALTVMWTGQVTTAFSPTLTFNNLSQGAVLGVSFANNNGVSAVTLKFAATDASANAYAINAVGNGGFNDMVGTGLSVSNAGGSNAAEFLGISGPTTTFNMMLTIG